MGVSGTTCLAKRVVSIYNLRLTVLQLELILILTGTLSADTWIGLNDRSSEGRYRWDADNSGASYTKWAGGQPDNDRPWYQLWWGDGEDCVMMLKSSSYYWNDADCDNNYRFACERPASITRG
ncbi:low affinity immunoglobulin epsilon Fc receptor-like [Penaeus monodon]|uniref:low affinity immunoglobulin epsilon Fc receptor-like n=1 Tax=Penaeus monodon TaxID=6687 RepID=UPI0018A7972B|nr:low affinity immunoglobulin epsilon Fc receptor-like [Penaeus monodon]